MNEIQQRADELYPDRSTADLAHERLRETYVKGAEEWYALGKKEGYIEGYIGGGLERDQLAARVKEIEKREAETVLSALDYQKQEHDQEMIAFTEWIYTENTYYPTSFYSKTPIIWEDFERRKYTTSELLELFRK